MKSIPLLFSILFFLDYSCLSQSLVISGRITDQENNKPLSGASVEVKGTAIGTTTNAEGRFSISTSAKGTLVFSSVGYVSRDIPVNSRSVINITLIAENKSLNEVVVI